MKRSTAISRLSDVADGLERAKVWPEPCIIAGYVFGALLDPPGDLERVQLALVVDEPADDVPWMSRPRHLEALARCFVSTSFRSRGAGVQARGRCGTTRSHARSASGLRVDPGFPPACTPRRTPPRIVTLDKPILTGQSARVSRQAVDGAELARDYALALPSMLRNEAISLLEALPAAEFRSQTVIHVVVEGEQVAIPYRIYNPVPSESELSALCPIDGVILSCLYSRHHDGRVRQRFTRDLVKRPYSWVAPFVVELLGVYVIEIVQDIAAELDLAAGSAGERIFGRYVVANPRRFHQVKQRAISYWNCYHRFTFPVLRPGSGGKFAEYPAFAVLDQMERAAAVARSV